MQESLLFKFLARCIALILGVALLADAGLPTRVEPLRVDRHTSYIESNTGGRSAGDTSYTLHLTGGVATSCSVGHALYMRLKDGEAVEVQSTRLFKKCIRIAQGDEDLLSDTYWKIFTIVCGALLLALAFGWVRNDDEDRDGFRVRVGW